MDLLKYLEEVKDPWYHSNTEKVDVYVQNFKINELLLLIQQLDTMFSIYNQIRLNPEDALPQNILDYASFLHGDLTDQFQDIRKNQEPSQVKRILESYEIPHPSDEQINWTKNWWLKNLLMDQIRIVLLFLGKPEHKDLVTIHAEQIGNSVLRHLRLADIHLATPLISFVYRVIPKKALEILPLFIKESSDSEIKRFAEDYLELIHYNSNNPLD